MDVVAGDEQIARSPIMRVLWFLLGWLAVAVGAIGVIVPGLPTTGFMVLAAACFARSSPRFEQWVLGLPAVGPAVARYRAGAGMPRRAKVVAIGMLSVAVTISVVFFLDNTILRFVVLAAGAIGIWFILVRVPTDTGDDPLTT